jgi:probable O-glycosylation ligase (exosortase A-associated)
MRDIPLLLGFAVMLPMILMRPQVGVLAWCWTALLVPNVYVYGLAAGVRFNFWIAICTFVGWFFSREPKRIPSNPTMVLLVCFLAWGTVSTLFTVAPNASVSWTQWEAFIKTVALALVTMILMQTELRVKALLLAIALSMGFHGVLEALKFILSGGGHHIWGPGTSIIGDNNQFALAVIMLIPILGYLYRESKSKVLRAGLGIAILLQVVTVVGTRSRGGLIGVVALAAWMLVTTQRKLKFVVFAALIGVAALAVAPKQWYARMATIDTADQDSSFMTRVVAWKINTLAAIDRPLVGAGFKSTEQLPVWVTYAAGFNKLDFIPTDLPSLTVPRAAHSIYFQVLGDMGFPGLAIYLGLLVTAWRNSNAVIHAARTQSDLKWAGALARTLQYSMVPYLVSGAALNMAYFDLAYAIIALLAVLKDRCSEATAPKPGIVPLRTPPTSRGGMVAAPLTREIDDA